MTTTPHRHITICAFLSFVLTASVCWGAKAPISTKDRVKQSTHIITGKVISLEAAVKDSKIETGKGNKDTIFSIKVIVEIITKTKGNDVKKGTEILVVAWKPQTRIKLATIGFQGHKSVPKKGDIATFYLKKHGKSFDALMPNGIDISTREKKGAQ